MRSRARGRAGRRRRTPASRCASRCRAGRRSTTAPTCIARPMLVSDRPRPMSPAAMAAWIDLVLLRELQHADRQRAEDDHAEAVVRPLGGELGQQLPRDLALGLAHRSLWLHVVVDRLGAGALHRGRRARRRSPGPCCGCGRAPARSRRPCRRARRRTPASTGRPCRGRAQRAPARRRCAAPSPAARKRGRAACSAAQVLASAPPGARQQRQHGQRQQPQQPGVVEAHAEPRSASRQRRQNSISQASIGMRAWQRMPLLAAVAEELERATAGRTLTRSSRRGAKRGCARDEAIDALLEHHLAHRPVQGLVKLLERLAPLRLGARRRQATQRAPCQRERPMRARPPRQADVDMGQIGQQQQRDDAVGDRGASARSGCRSAAVAHRAAVRRGRAAARPPPAPAATPSPARLRRGPPAHAARP